MHAHLAQVQTARAAEQATTDLRQNNNRGGESGGIIGTIKRGQMKEISTKKCTNMQVSGYFKSHAKFIKDLIEHFDSTGSWTQIINTDVDCALHTVIRASLERI